MELGVTIFSWSCLGHTIFFRGKKRDFFQAEDVAENLSFNEFKRNLVLSGILYLRFVALALIKPQNVIDIFQ